MRQFVLTILSVVFFTHAQAGPAGRDKSITEIETTEGGYILRLKFDNVSILSAAGSWHSINIPGAAHSLEEGAPQMAYMSYSFCTADGAMELAVKNSSYVEYHNYDIIPSKGNLIRTQDPANIPLKPGPVYQQNEFYPASVAKAANDYMIRSAHGNAIHVFPVQYNPVTHTVRIYQTLEIEVKASHAIKPMDNALWDKIYSRQFVNYALLEGGAAKSTYSAPTETGDMLIVTQAQYMNALQPFVDWKKERGIRCYFMDLDTLSSGGDPDSIQSRIAWHYQQNNNLNFVLLIGDESDMPPIENTNVSGPSDIAYGYVSGNDHYPDLLVGRFSANNLQELQPQITKSIEYERNPTAAQAWYTRGMGIASNQGPGDDNQMDWEHMNAIRSQQLAASYTYIYEAYDGTHDVNIAPLDNPGDPGEQEVIDAINAGVSLVNYCGHGSSTSLGTTGFSNNDVPSLTNTNGQWPFIITVACVTGEFMNGNTSLGERLMIATQSGQPYGMVGGLMSSINQSWDPPMQGQDEMNEIINDISTVKLYAAAAITAAGTMSMNDAYLNDGYDMTDTWIFFGDPSLQLRYKSSDTLTAVHPDSIFFYETNLGVQLNKAYGTVVLLHNDTIYSVHTTSNFNTAHTFSALPAGDSLMVIATAPNTAPYYGKVRIADTAGTLSAVVGLPLTNELMLYPNPAGNRVFVKGIKAPTPYDCIDITGRLLLHGTIGETNSKISTEVLPPGSYIIRLYGKDTKKHLPLQILR